MSVLTAKAFSIPNGKNKFLAEPEYYKNSVMKTQKKAPPTIIVIFGGTGDLAKRKLIPAFYNLFKDGWMSDKFAIVGLGYPIERRRLSSATIRRLKQFFEKR
jgi:hypothetical protein